MSMVVDRRQALPANLVPRGLSRLEAAAYVGVGATLFDEMVRDHRMPQGMRFNSRVIWDRTKLDAAFEALADEASGDDPWGKLAL